MELIVLGSGAFTPARLGPVRNPAGYAVKLDNRLLLFDFGFGNLRQLARAGLRFEDVTDVFLSHRHPDHCGDLPALLFALHYDAKPRAGRLRVWGPSGLTRFVRGLQRTWSPWLAPEGYRLELRELSEGRAATGAGWRVECLRVPHPTPALAYRLSYKGKKLVYSGDTGYDARLADFASGCDLFLLECTLGERDAYSGHLKPSQALTLAAASRCRRALLTHLSEDSLRELARRRLGRGVGLARDRMRTTV